MAGIELPPPFVNVLSHTCTFFTHPILRIGVRSFATFYISCAPVLHFRVIFILTFDVDVSPGVFAGIPAAALLTLPFHYYHFVPLRLTTPFVTRTSFVPRLLRHFAALRAFGTARSVTSLPLRYLPLTVPYRCIHHRCIPHCHFILPVHFLPLAAFT